MPGSRNRPMDLGGLNNHQVHDFARFHAAPAGALGAPESSGREVP